jgi:hypothetical protein
MRRQLAGRVSGGVSAFCLPFSSREMRSCSGFAPPLMSCPMISRSSSVDIGVGDDSIIKVTSSITVNT